MVAASADAAFCQAARALANAALSVDAAADGAGADAEPTGVLDTGLLAGAVEADAATVAVAVCGVLGGALDPAELHAAANQIVASNTPVTGRNRSLVMSTLTRELGVRLECYWRLGSIASASDRWATRVTPEQVGLPAGANRRVPGLRREELAMLAGISAGPGAPLVTTGR